VLARRNLSLDAGAWSGWASDIFDGQEHVEQSRSREAYVAWERQRLRAVVDKLPVDDVEELVAELHASSKDFTMAAYEEVPGVLAGLREQGVTVAVCSNWDWDLDRAIEQAGLAEAADVVVTSARVGARKPHPAIFAATLERCRVRPAEAVFVGDTWGPDVEGPRAVGMRAVHLCRPDRPGPTPPLPPGVRRISDLRRL